MVRRLLSSPDALAGVFGLALVGIGVGLIYLPAALIVIGVALVALAVWGG